MTEYNNMSTEQYNDDFDENFNVDGFEEEIEGDDIEIPISLELNEDIDNIDSIALDDEPSSEEDLVLSKHKLQDKHRLKYDSIFKGKKEEPIEEYDYIGTNVNDNFEVDRQSGYYTESIDNESYVRDKLLKEKVYEILKNNTNVNFSSSRRKPSKVDFNDYFSLLVKKLDGEGFTNSEILVELSVYFSDNLFNMFKLLDSKWRNSVLTELKSHIGNQTYSNEIMNRNIYVGTEVEFLHNDGTGKEIHITGEVVETDYQYSTFKVNSYVDVYEVHLDKITKIINNTKFRYNLNKLNYIDFL